VIGVRVGGRVVRESEWDEGRGEIESD